MIAVTAVCPALFSNTKYRSGEVNHVKGTICSETTGAKVSSELPTIAIGTVILLKVALPKT